MLLYKFNTTPEDAAMIFSHMLPSVELPVDQAITTATPVKRPFA